MFELLALFFSTMALSFYLLFDHIRKTWRDRRLSESVSCLLNSLQGAKVDDAVEQLGDPAEILEGPSGRKLYVWNSHRTPKLPQTNGFVVISLTVNEVGEIVQASWKG